MSAAVIAVLVVVGLLVVALAAFLLVVVAVLRRLTDVLGKVTFGVRAIAYRVQPVGPAIEELNADLTAVADAVEALAAKVGSRAARAS